MPHLICLDPGKRHSGIAIFDPAKTLRAATVVKNLRGMKEERGAVCQAMADEIVQLVSLSVVHRDRELVIEWPQVYQRSRSRADPDDILHLAGVCGAVAAGLACRVHSYQAGEWKGQVDADAMTWRIEQQLSEAERARIHVSQSSLRHNAVDAVGIGLYHLGRLERVRVYPQ